MSKYVILNWNKLEDISLALDRDGSVLVYDSEAKANIFARRNFTWNWKVIEVEKA